MINKIFIMFLSTFCLLSCNKSSSPMDGKCKVSFRNYDQTYLTSYKINKGEKPEYKGSILKRLDDNKYEFKLLDCNTKITNIKDGKYNYNKEGYRSDTLNNGSFLKAINDMKKNYNPSAISIIEVVQSFLTSSDIGLPNEILNKVRINFLYEQE